MTADTADEPERLGRYQLLHKIAHGGMATVYLATFSGPGGFKKVVALKRIHSHLAEEPAFVDMFLDEARIASRIHHSNVCAVNDFGESDGTFYIAMEYLYGEPLSRILRAAVRNEQVRSDPRHALIACRIVADACEGLHAAHELRGRDGQLLEVVHRDISPQNLFVTFDGNVKVVDFGIASAADRLHHTQGGQIKGKFAYMSPEQATGKPIDRRADVWSLGVVLWEVITMRRLFHGDGPMATLQTVIGGEIPPPSLARKDIDVPAEVDAVVLRALARDPEERYPTTRALGRDLVQAMASTGTLVTAPDLSDWMNRLFPAGEQRAHELMEAIERSEPIETDASPTPVSDAELSAVRPRGGGEEAATTPRQPPAPSEESTATVQTPPPTFAGAGARRGRSRVLWGAVAVAVLIGVAVAGWLVGRPGDGPDAGDAAAGAPTATAGDPLAERGTAPTEAEPEPEAEPVAGADEPEAEAVAQAEEEPEAEASPADEGEAQRTGSAERRRAARLRRERRRRAAEREAASATSPEPQQPSTGTVAVFTPGGWANVHGRGGRLLGQTPLRLTLPAGTHDLELRPFGQPPGRRLRVEVTGGETTRVVQSLSE